MAWANSGFFMQLSADLYFWAEDLRPSDPGKGVVFAPDFFLTRFSSFTAASIQILTRGQMHLKFSSEEKVFPELVWVQPPLEEFTRFFTEAQNLMAQGRLEKIVPVVFARASFRPEKFHFAYLVERLLKAPPNLFAYGFWYDNEAIFGATPEILFRRNGENLSTMALAGTRPQGDPLRSPLLEDEKELFEHRLVAHDLREKLSAWGEVECGETQVLNLPSLQHLKTDLSVRLKTEVSFVELMQTLHPTPALGGYPSRECMSLLKRWAPERARFGAPFGVRISESESLCLVAIRNLQFTHDQAFLGSGCGLVRASRWEREWDELAKKRQSVLRLLGLA